MPASASLPPSLRPTADELAVGQLFGLDPAAPPLPPAAHPSTRAALEAVLAEALAQPPCVIAFSGGRDSSVLLAIAEHVARREGLPAPLAATDRYLHVPQALEDDWQAQVVAHLGVSAGRWLRLDRAPGEHEVLGAQAQAAMRRHGVLLPGTWAAAGMPPEAGPGGTLVTGYGGDELFSPPPRPALARLAAGLRPGPRTLLRLPGETLPRPLRRRLAQRRAAAHEMAWLRPEAARRIAALEAADELLAPARFDRMLALAWRDRDLRSGAAAGALMAAESGARCVDPFVDPRVLAAAAAEWGAAWPPSRAAALRRLAADLLPAEVLSRRSKADFTHVFYGEHSRRWVHAWDGTGADEARVDPAALRAELLRPEPDARAVPSLQVAWLAGDGGS